MALLLHMHGYPAQQCVRLAPVTSCCDPPSGPDADNVRAERSGRSAECFFLASKFRLPLPMPRLTRGQHTFPRHHSSLLSSLPALAHGHRSFQLPILNESTDAATRRCSHDRSSSLSSSFNPFSPNSADCPWLELKSILKSVNAQGTHNSRVHTLLPSLGVLYEL